MTETVSAWVRKQYDEHTSNLTILRRDFTLVKEFIPKYLLSMEQ